MDGPGSSEFTDDQLKLLSSFCFETLQAKLSKKKMPSYPESVPDPSYPIFVTWTTGKEEDLRGCIGTFSGDKPLSHILGQYAIISSL